MRATDFRPVLLALVLSLGLHLPVLWRAADPVAAAPARAMAVRLQAPPVPQPAPDEPSPTRRSLPAPATERPAESPPPATAPLEAPAAPVPLLRLAGPAEWSYQLRQGGQDGEARLSWQPAADGSYVLRLSRRIGERALPDLQSLGHTGRGGLMPDRFALQRRGQDRQAINFDQQAGQLRFSATPDVLDLPDGTQDRLSWWLQLAALVEATPQPAPGQRWRVWVAGLRGELREWSFELDGEGPGLHLRRLPLGPEDPGVEVWLDPRRGYWPARLRQGDPEKRGFEITSVDSPGSP